jgi:ferritin-like metal-binding protein YciE
MQLNSLETLLVDQLKDLLSAEKQISKALPKMKKAASSEELQRLFEEHVEQTRRQMERLEQVFQMLGQSPGRKKCKGIEGIIEEGKEYLEEEGDPSVIDAALISSAQHVEHYEIASYGTARTFAQMVGRDDAAKLLQESLDEEQQTNDKLTQIAVSQVNKQAV